jgi:3-dehydroquinate synthase
MVNRAVIARRAAFVLVLGAIVIVPFMLLGEDFGKSWLTESTGGRVWVVATAVLLLAVDAVLPIPSSWVLIALANQAGVVAGIVGGTLGLTAGVMLAAWIGRTAVGPVASRLVPAADLERLRSGAPRQVVIGLVCLRSIPVLAEMSVLAAAAARVPLRRILVATVPANLVIATVYSLAADESLTAATVVFLVTVGLSYVLWRWAGRNAP